MVIVSASQTKGSQSTGKGKGKPSGKPVEAKKSSSSFSRPEVKLAGEKCVKPGGVTTGDEADGPAA